MPGKMTTTSFNTSFLVVGYTQQRQILSKKKNRKGKILKIFINSENLRGRRPVTEQIAGKDP